MKISLLFSLALIVFRVEADLNELQKRRCEQFTNVFDHDSIQFNYGYVHNHNNGRGFTAGRAGFTTSSGDAYEVVRRYCAKKPDNPLAKFEPELKILGERGSSDVSQLKGYVVGWRRSSRDPLFRSIQDDVCDHLYYRPAMRLAENLNIKSALGKCAIYDAILQHGNDDNPDSINSLIMRTELSEGGPVLVTNNEEKWIREFLRIRRINLEHPNDKQLQIEWRESVDRVDAFLDLINHKNWELNQPIHIETPFHRHIIL